MNGAPHPAPVVAAPDAQRIELRMSDRESALVAQAMRRVEAIMSAPEASGPNADLARFLAFQTDQPTDVVLSILKVAAAGAAKPADDRWGRFFAGQAWRSPWIAKCPCTA